MGLFDALRMMMGGKKPADPAATDNATTLANLDTPSANVTGPAPSTPPAETPASPAPSSGSDQQPKA